MNTSSITLDADNEAIAAFAQLEWAWTDHWRTTLGLRYTDESRELSRRRFQVIPETLDANGGPVSEVAPDSGLYARGPDFEYNPLFGFELADRARADTDNDAVTPMGSVQYLIDGRGVVDTGSVYLTYSEGFLSGGLSEGPTGQLEEFKPEEVENWELGFKLDLFASTLRINAALFHADYTNRPLTTLAINPETNSPAPATINARKSTIQGLELETTWLPTERLLLTLNLTVNDGDIDEFMDTLIAIADVSRPPAAGCTRSDLTFLQVDSCPNDRSNENLPRLPEHTLFFAADYTLDTPLGKVIPRVQLSYKSDIDFCFDSASCRSGLWLEDEQFDLSARLTWISRDEKWIGALYGTNLTDEVYIIGASPLVESEGVGGFANALPRMYGVELQYQF